MIRARCSVLSLFTILTIMLEGSDSFGARKSARAAEGRIILIRNIGCRHRSGLCGSAVLANRCRSPDVADFSLSWFVYQWRDVEAFVPVIRIRIIQ